MENTKITIDFLYCLTFVVINSEHNNTPIPVSNIYDGIIIQCKFSRWLASMKESGLSIKKNKLHQPTIPKHTKVIFLSIETISLSIFIGNW